MVEKAYRGWSADLRSGKSSILIAPDNDSVTTLNERSHADLVESGRVDAEHTVPLADGLTAGRGDTIIARKNNRRLIDTNGEYLRNGTLLRITKRPHRDGTITARRVDTGATISLSHVYLGTSAELGYATTAHRSQGITVDTSHIVLAQGCLTRELFYVGMTRGRNSNTAYVCETSPALDEPPTGRPTTCWRQILGEVLAAEGAERTAHEVRAAEIAKGDTLQRLAAEYDYLAQLAAADSLTSAISRVMPDVVTHLQESPSWGAGVAVWRRAAASSAAAAQRVLEGALKHPGDAQDHMSVVHARLRQTVSNGHMEASPDVLDEALFTERTDLADMISQVRTRTINRQNRVAAEALSVGAPWVRQLETTLGPAVKPDQWAAAVSGIAIFRDRWEIATSTDPLGPVPASYEWEQSEQRESLQRRIQSMIESPSGSFAESASALPAPIVHHPFIPVGPTL